MKPGALKLIATGVLLMITANAQANQNPADTLEIIRAVNTIGTAADGKDWKKCRAQFGDEVLADYSALTGQPAAKVKADALLEGWAKALGPVKMTQHMITNHEVEIQGQTATVFSYVTAMHHHPVKSGRDFWLLFGKYEHRLVKSPGGWRVVAMKLVPTYQSGNTKLLQLVGEGR